MNKAIIIASVALSGLAFAPSALAAGQFNSYLHYGMSSNQVKSLQQYLGQKGYFKGPQTGNFLGMTQSAVKSYQAANGIPATGYVGPLTVAALNSSATGPSTSLSFVSAPVGSVDAGQAQKVAWTSKGPAPASVSVNLIKKVSDNPARYALVRTVAAAKANNGSATWVPAPTDVGTGLSIEVGCVASANACTAAENTSAPLAVVNDGRYANTASAYQSIESFLNQ